MKLNDEQRIEAPRQRVYEALNDPEILRQCIPGCQSLDKTSDTEMEATVALKVGPVSARFKGNVTLQDLDPPNGYTIVGEGKGGTAGFAKGSAAVRLTELEPGVTVLHYEVSADLGGKIAQLGGRLIEGTARKLSAQFFTKFSECVEGGAEQAPVGEAKPAEEALPEPAVAAAAAGTGATVAHTGAPVVDRLGVIGLGAAAAGLIIAFASLVL